MKYLFLTVTVVSIFLLMFFVILLNKHKKGRIDKILILFNASGAVLIFLNMCSNVAKTRLGIMISWQTYYIFMDWFVMILMLTCTVYTGITPGKKIRFVYAALIADTLNLGLNVFFKHCFELVDLRFVDGLAVYTIDWHTPYYIHTFMCNLLILNASLVLVSKIRKVPMIYAVQYIAVLIGTVSVMVLDNLNHFWSLPIEWSVFFYSVLTLGATYLIKIYIPRYLLLQSNAFAANTINTGVSLYDIDDNCLFVNRFTLEYFMITEDELTRKGGYLEQTLQGRRIEELIDSEDTEKVNSIVIAGVEKFYKFSVQRNVDKKGNTIGTIMLVHDVTELVEHTRADHIKATCDDLTGIYNRRYFMEECARLLDKKNYKDYVLVCSDILNFRMMNEVFGPEISDDVLIRFADYIRKMVSSNEIIFGRIGGDDFAILLPKQLFNEEAFIRCSKEVMDSVKPGEKLRFECKMGVYEVNEVMPIVAMCDRAQIAIRSIRNAYGVSIAYFNDEMEKAISLEQNFNLSLSNAILNGEICIFIQPQVNEKGKTLGGECLVRWKRSDGSYVNPGEFIPIFERNGRIVEIDKCVWELACRKLREWKDMGREELYLSINISPKDIILLDIYQVITGLVEKYEINPHNLKLEITESAVMKNVESANKLIKELQNYGFVVEMDDFGSGYSSLNMLKDIPVNVLKLDMVFLQKTKNMEKSRIILDSVVNLASRLDLKVIVEGVETSEQVEFLSGIGCDCFQGYYFSRPVTVEDFENRVDIAR